MNNAIVCRMDGHGLAMKIGGGFCVCPDGQCVDLQKAYKVAVLVNGKPNETASDLLTDSERATVEYRRRQGRDDLVDILDRLAPRAVNS